MVREQKPRRMQMPDTLLRTAPNRVWEQTFLGEWVSRDWKPGEKQKYINSIAHRSGMPVW